MPPRGHLYSLSKEEQLAMKFESEGLRQGALRPSSSPLPLTNTTLDALSDATMFLKLDLRNAYNLVCIREGEEWKTAFITPYGHYEMLVMPFGLCNSSAAFQQFINNVLWDMLGRWVFV